MDDLKNGLSTELISAKFHHTVINIIFVIANKIRKEHRINKVALSGGSFQNKFILKRIENKLKGDGFEVFSHEQTPANDGGIALGQLAIAAKRRALKMI